MAIFKIKQKIFWSFPLVICRKQGSSRGLRDSASLKHNLISCSHHDFWAKQEGHILQPHPLRYLRLPFLYPLGRVQGRMLSWPGSHAQEQRSTYGKVWTTCLPITQEAGSLCWQPPNNPKKGGRNNLQSSGEEAVVRHNKVHAVKSTSSLFQFFTFIHPLQETQF